MRLFPALAVCLLLAACGQEAPKPAKPIAQPQEAISRIGDVAVRAHVLPTMQLNEAVARRYGIERRDDTAMLLVGVRQGPDGQDVALPATITATVKNLGGETKTVALREVRTGAPGATPEQTLIDYVGTTTFSPPDTLTFDIKVVRDNGAVATMRFVRDVAAE